MPSATIETSEEASKPSVRDRVVDACRQTAHLSHEARLLKSLATDAVEDGVHAAKRAITSVKRGSTNSRTSKMRPFTAAWAAPGVTQVDDRLAIVP